MSKQVALQRGRALSAAAIAAEQRDALSRYCSWQRFHDGVRRSGMPLLRTLPRYARSVLVAGCQRSGTTMLTRIIANAAGFQPFRLTHDDELDAALVLAGHVDLPADRRYCFQTTYLNERFAEYAALGADQKLIWVLRNPRSVVYSMVYNWKRFALEELYEDCVSDKPSRDLSWRRAFPWPIGTSLIEKACLAYSAKNAQIFDIRTRVDPTRLLLVDYDELVSSPEAWLPRVFDFIGEPYAVAYADAVQKDSLRKASRLPARASTLIERHCAQMHRECRALVTVGPG